MMHTHLYISSISAIFVTKNTFTNNKSDLKKKDGAMATWKRRYKAALCYFKNEKNKIPHCRNRFYRNIPCM